MAFNPFFNWPRDRVLAAIDEIQDRIAAGQQQTSRFGVGSVINVGQSDDRQNLQWLAARLAEIDGTPNPARKQITAYVVRQRDGVEVVTRPLDGGH